MTAKQSQLQTEMKTSQSVRKLTSEERSRKMFRELRAVEMGWRAKAALVELEQCKKKEERGEQTQMQKESIEEAWKERRATQLKVDEESSFQRLTSEQKGQEQRRRKTLYNNWVGEPRTGSELHPDGFIHHSTEKSSQECRGISLLLFQKAFYYLFHATTSSLLIILSSPTSNTKVPGASAGQTQAQAVV